jgi:hypothetical protein
MYRERFFPHYSVHHGRLTLTVYSNSLSYKPAVTISLTDGSGESITETITFEFLDTLIEQAKSLHKQFCESEESSHTPPIKAIDSTEVLTEIDKTPPESDFL